VRQFLLGHLGLGQGRLCVGATPGMAQGDGQVHAQNPFLSTALAAGAQADGGVAALLQRRALCLQPGLLRLGLCQLQLMVVGQDLCGPVGGVPRGYGGGVCVGGGWRCRGQVHRRGQAGVQALQRLQPQLGLPLCPCRQGLDAGCFGLGGQQFELGSLFGLNAALGGAQLLLGQLGLGLEHGGMAHIAQRVKPGGQQAARRLVPGVGQCQLAQSDFGFTQFSVGRDFAGPAHTGLQGYLGLRKAGARAFGAPVGRCSGHPVVGAGLQALAAGLG